MADADAGRVDALLVEQRLRVLDAAREAAATATVIDLAAAAGIRTVA